LREERGQLSGDQIISEPVELTGNISGDAVVIDGGKLYMRGSVYGDMHVEEGGRVHIFGHLMGSLHVEKGAKVIVSGVVGRDCHNNGGRLYIDAMARVGGKIRTREGETRVDPHAKVGSENK
jgi:predicted acyltransferase (DUF342 family)